MLDQINSLWARGFGCLYMSASTASTFHLLTKSLFLVPSELFKHLLFRAEELLFLSLLLLKSNPLLLFFQLSLDLSHSFSARNSVSLLILSQFLFICRLFLSPLFQ
jgi:hypothetical protein